MYFFLSNSFRINFFPLGKASQFFFLGEASQNFFFPLAFQFLPPEDSLQNLFPLESASQNLFFLDSASQTFFPGRPLSIIIRHGSSSFFTQRIKLILSSYDYSHTFCFRSRFHCISQLPVQIDVCLRVHANLEGKILLCLAAR